MASRVTTFAVLVLGIAASLPAQAADPFYIGSWKFSDAIAAPWFDGQADRKAMAQFKGKTVVIRTKAIAAPSVFACKQPKYAVHDIPPEGLFQGAFDDMQRKDKNVVPSKLAAALGFTTTIKTLQTGCPIDFHFVDETTAQAALDNVTYTLKKQKR